MKRLLIITASMLLATASCDRTRTTTGWDYAPDMYYSEAYESYTPNDVFADGKTLQDPVKGTVPRGMIPFAYEKTDEDRVKAGEEMQNPLDATPAVLQRGSEAYHIFCVDCHGEKGDGQGFLYTSKRYPYPPASLVNDKVKDLPDGSIYHTITVGYGVMGAHGAMIRPADRWSIIEYIREELQN